MISNVVLVLGVQQSDSVIHMCICVCVSVCTSVSIVFQILFPFRLLQNIKQYTGLYSRSLLVIYFFIYLFLVIYFKYGNVYMSTPNSQYFLLKRKDKRFLP